MSNEKRYDFNRESFQERITSLKALLTQNTTPSIDELNEHNNFLEAYLKIPGVQHEKILLHAAKALVIELYTVAKRPEYSNAEFAVPALQAELIKEKIVDMIRIDTNNIQQTQNNNNNNNNNNSPTRAPQYQFTISEFERRLNLTKEATIDNQISTFKDNIAFLKAFLVSHIAKKIDINRGTILMVTNASLIASIMNDRLINNAGIDTNEKLKLKKDIEETQKEIAELITKRKKISLTHKFVHRSYEHDLTDIEHVKKLSLLVNPKQNDKPKVKTLENPEEESIYLERNFNEYKKEFTNDAKYTPAQRFVLLERALNFISNVNKVVNGTVRNTLTPYDAEINLLNRSPEAIAKILSQIVDLTTIIYGKSLSTADEDNRNTLQNRSGKITIDVMTNLGHLRSHINRNRNASEDILTPIQKQIDALPEALRTRRATSHSFDNERRSSFRGGVSAFAKLFIDASNGLSTSLNGISDGGSSSSSGYSASSSSNNNNNSNLPPIQEVDEGNHNQIQNPIVNPIVEVLPPHMREDPNADTNGDRVKELLAKKMCNQKLKKQSTTNNLTNLLHNGNGSSSTDGASFACTNDEMTFYFTESKGANNSNGNTNKNHEFQDPKFAKLSKGNNNLSNGNGSNDMPF